MTSPPKRCNADRNALEFGRRIGYYNLAHRTTSCHRMELEDLEIVPLTHLNLAFVNFGADFKLENEHGGLLFRASLLKIKHAALRVVMSVGGRSSSNDAASASWSDLASTPGNRQTFIRSVADFLVQYGLDGVDLALESPLSPGGGWRPEDAANFVQLLAEMRTHFNTHDPGWTITVIIPASGTQLEKHDIGGMKEHISWFNLMPFDRHWASHRDLSPEGSHVRGHTDLAEVDEALSTLQQRGVSPDSVVLGMAFHGRVHALKDRDCWQPNGACELSMEDQPVACSEIEGILTYAELSSRNKTDGFQTHYNASTTLKYGVSEDDEWMSYDDEESWHDKKSFLSRNCLAGLFIWSLDEDGANFKALSGLMGDYSRLQLNGGGASPGQLRARSEQLSPFTGQHCFVTSRCTDGSEAELGPDQACPGGYQSVSTAHSPKQAPGRPYDGECRQGWFRHVCCPRATMPKNCKWSGGQERQAFGCHGGCKDGQFELNTDGYRDAQGNDSCFHGTRSLCCDSTPAISGCHWTECQGPLAAEERPACPDGYQYQTYRHDEPGKAGSCSGNLRVGQAEGSEPDGEQRYRFKSALCCPKGRGFSQCSWSNDVPESKDTARLCGPHRCSEDEVEVGRALEPPVPSVLGNESLGYTCDAVAATPGQELRFSYCCAPPGPPADRRPVRPEQLWGGHGAGTAAAPSEVLWYYSEHSSETEQEDAAGEQKTDGEDDEYGQDPYGFVMLDGPLSAIDNSFASVHTVVREQPHVPIVKRSALTDNQTVLRSVFDHAEETLHVYCNYPAGSEECARIWIDGAEDTIIRLPAHVGEGPFARIVSIQAAHDEFELPAHHLRHRSLGGLSEPVYELKIDYDFRAIRHKRHAQPVNIRVDYTNLRGYWDSMTVGEALSKRSADGSLPKLTDWHERVNGVIQRDKALRRRAKAPVNITKPMEAGGGQGGRLEKRWWGEFTAWLAKLTAIKKSHLGVLPLGWADTINLFRSKKGCIGSGASASLTIDLEAAVNMDLTYAYYFSGTVIPPSMPDAYAYLGMEPTAYVGLHIEGSAQMQYKSEQTKLIPTITYPGLAIKGLVSIGPSLDIYGQIEGTVTISGEARAGAHVNFGKAEVYWPQDHESSQKYQKLLGIDSRPSVPDRDFLTPVFEADVELDAGLDVTVQPQANFGIQIGGGSLTAGLTIVDAQLSGYLKGGLSFQASSHFHTESDQIKYSYGVYLFYNLGYSAHATILGLVNWALEPREAFHPSRRVNVYGPVQGTIPVSSSGDRNSSQPDSEPEPEPELDEPQEATPTEPPESIPLAASTNAPQLLARAPKRASPASRKNANPTFQNHIDCPASRKRKIKLPELRYNCDLLGSTKVMGNSNYSVSVLSGMCQAWKKLDPFPAVLTFSGDEARRKRRKAIQCPANYCKRQSYEQWIQTGRKIATSCSDTPPSSAEEGGDFLPASSRARACVPSYQASHWTAASCQKLMLNLASNWGEMEPEPPAKGRRVANWVHWTDNKKWTTKGKHGGNVQRTTTYPSKMPRPDGMSKRPSLRTSWVFRRNYTWSAIDNVLDSRKWWGASNYDLEGSRRGQSEAKPSDGWGSVLCAMNTFGQSHVYKWKGKYNAYCLRQRHFDSDGFQRVRRVARCQVVFRKSGPMNGGDWEVERVEYANDPEDDDTIPESTEGAEAPSGSDAEDETPLPPEPDAPDDEEPSSPDGLEPIEQDRAADPSGPVIERRGGHHMHQASHRSHGHAGRPSKRRRRKDPAVPHDADSHVLA
ncbi:hypothetical protein CDD83_7878 [Cordyceps sp. RAO-2017]|nr:hypothetical protein CDD83_7878 [Cordyceps sp. RAO-2017]